MTTVHHLQSVADVPPIEPEPVGTLAPLVTVPIGQHFKITPTGLDVIGEPSWQACEEFGEMLRTFDASLQFVIGDYGRYMRGRWGEEASQILDATGWSEKTLHQYIRVAENVPAENRLIDRGLSFKHHLNVASLTPAKQRLWLAKALGDGPAPAWSANRLQAELKEQGETKAETFGFYVLCTGERQRQRLMKLVELEGGVVKGRRTDE